ncbi:MAG TPA: polysaccharide biosynthesis/export family protein [Gemmatimonadales bacterium]|nr:polysaccharide biosynthesis/export family protein [Gemmatimonadales bacterium]
MRLVLTLLLTVGSLSRAAAQAESSSVSAYSRRLSQSRSELERQLQRLITMDATGRYEGGMSRELVSSETSYIRRRLEEGDFHAGDRVLIAVEDPEPPATVAATPVIKSTEQQLSDTFTVGAAQELTLPVVGVVRLRGVLRSELEALLSQEISRVIRDPVVHARPLVGLVLAGELTRPGYYSVPADAVIPAVLMAAGGTTQQAKLAKLKIQRDGKTIWEGDALRRAIAEGRTVDELELRPGDVLTVPRGGTITGLYGPAQLVAVLLGIPVTIYTLTKIFH